MKIYKWKPKVRITPKPKYYKTFTTEPNFKSTNISDIPLPKTEWLCQQAYHQLVSWEVLKFETRRPDATQKKNNDLDEYREFECYNRVDGNPVEVDINKKLENNKRTENLVLFSGQTKKSRNKLEQSVEYIRTFFYMEVFLL